MDLLGRSIKPGRSYFDYKEHFMYCACEKDSEDDPQSCAKYLKCRKRVGGDAKETSSLQIRKESQDGSEDDEEQEKAE